MREGETPDARRATLPVVVLAILSLLLSLGAVALPAWLDPGMRQYGGLIPVVSTGYEGYSIVTAVLLLVVGVLLGCTFRVSREVLVGAVVAPIPLWILADTFLGPDPSNIWPIALVFGFLTGAPTVVGALVGHRLRRRA